MNRALLIILLYIFVGTVFTIVGYRLALEGAFNLPGVDKTTDGLIGFIAIVMNIALAFAAAAVWLSMMLPNGISPGPAMLISGLLAGVIGYGMTFWFTGLTIAFPIVMAAGGVVCSSTANMLGLFRPTGSGRP